MNRVVLLLALFLAPLVQPVQAQESRGDEYLRKGHYYFKQGYYLKASEHFRLALLEDPGSAEKKLAFGHALFAIGNYSYASYALRRGVAQLPRDAEFRPDVQGLFPSKRAFEQALRDLKRYVTYSPRDPAGLTVLGYVLFSRPGEARRCRDMFTYLQRLDREDPFAAYFLERIEGADDDGQASDEGEEPMVELPVEEPAPAVEAIPVPAPVPPAPATTRALREVVKAEERAVERTAAEWPAPTPALSD